MMPLPADVTNARSLRYSARVGQMRSRHYAIRVGLVLIITADTFRRMLYGTRPIDEYMLVVELLALLIIGLEAAVHLTRHFKKRHRLRNLFNCLSHGQELLDRRPSDGPTAWSDWKLRFKEWRDNTSKLLAHYSPQAAAFFLHRHDAPSRIFLGIRQDPPPQIVELIEYLENLRSIMENPDIYF